MELKNMLNLGSRTGRTLQRYKKGRRQVVGCIPYRYKTGRQASSESTKVLEVLVISSQRKDKGMMFPKGGWETDETMEEAALRETVEEAGVLGIIEGKLGKWSFKGINKETFYDGYLFPLRVEKQLDFWPEKDTRQRRWMGVKEAKEACQHFWMKEALDRLECRLTSQQHEEERVSLSSSS